MGLLEMLQPTPGNNTTTPYEVGEWVLVLDDENREVEGMIQEVRTDGILALAVGEAGFYLCHHSWVVARDGFSELSIEQYNEARKLGFTHEQLRDGKIRQGFRMGYGPPQN